MADGISNEAFGLMVEEGRLRYPNEACGLIVKVGKKSIAVACENSHESPYSNFRISGLEYARCAKMGEVVGVWHTHTDENAQPSLADRERCEFSGLPWYIAAINKDGDELIATGPVVIEPTGFETPYLGRPYVFGIHDCYTLICDYYKREFGIHMRRDYPRIEEWWNKGHDFFTENFAAEGFVSLIGQEPQVGDVFIIQSGAQVGSHVAIYIGDDMILHHCHGRLSTRDIYGGYWAKHTINHLRHESKC